MRIELPQKVLQVLASNKRYKVLYGGRGSAKSWSIARYLIVLASVKPIRILCTREIQKSIRDSVHKLLSDQIESLGLSGNFIIQEKSIFGRCGSEFLFKGLRHDVGEIKSTEGIDVCWVEEAEQVAEESWRVLTPTIRKEGSQIIVAFNPDDEKSATYTRFVEKDGKPSQIEDCAIAEVNYCDNPWFPDVLRREMEYDKRVDFEKYEHVWMGKPKKYGNACIFKGKIFVEDFETPEGVQFFFGADFGFSQDPTCLVRMWIKDNILYIDHEAYGVGVEIEELPGFFKSVPEVMRWSVTADCARPETISFLNQKDFNITPSKKGKGSVEDGIEFLRSFEKIMIHPRCTGSISDFQNYKWKVDRITSAILPIPVDSSNHSPDAVRYALEAYINADVPLYWSA